jgi:hypothetical protein
MDGTFFEVELTEEQELEAAQIEDVLKGAAAVEFRRFARLLASKANREFFGETEFQLRDIVHRLGARGIDAALAERKKRGTKGRALSARNVVRNRDSNDTLDARSPR